MAITLPLETMSIEEKLSVIEDVMNSLSHSSEKVPVPEWHLTELESRPAEVKAGTAKIYSLDEAKDLVRRLTR